MPRFTQREACCALVFPVAEEEDIDAAIAEATRAPPAPIAVHRKIPDPSTDAAARLADLRLCSWDGDWDENTGILKLWR